MAMTKHVRLDTIRRKEVSLAHSFGSWISKDQAAPICSPVRSQGDGIMMGVITCKDHHLARPEAWEAQGQAGSFGDSPLSGELGSHENINLFLEKCILSLITSPCPTS